MPSLIIVCVHAYLRTQRSRKRRNTSAPSVPATKSAKVMAKVKIKVEPPDEVTCSTDDVKRQSSATAETGECEENADDYYALSPDTTTENIGRDVIDVSADPVITSFSGTCPSVSNKSVEEMAVSNHSVSALVVPSVNTVATPTSSIIGHPYQYRHPYHYVSIHQAAPLQYYPSHIAGSDLQCFPDDIDDVLSVVASVAGITRPPHVFNY